MACVAGQCSMQSVCASATPFMLEATTRSFEAAVVVCQFTMEKRILLALALSFLLITLTRPLWEPERSPQPQPDGKDASKEIAQQAPEQVRSIPESTAQQLTVGGGIKTAEAERWIEVETDLYRLQM